MAVAEVAPRAHAVVVALDASPVSHAVLDVAAGLAARLDARLDAVYVEEAQWLAAAALPCARWVAGHTGAAQGLTAAQVELTWRAAATRLRATLAAQAGADALRWSLAVVRGPAGASLVEAGRGARLLALGMRGWQRQGLRVGSAAREVLAHCVQPVALVPVGARRPRYWLAVVDDARTAAAVLDLGSALARGGAPLRVLATTALAQTARAALAGVVPADVVQATVPGALPATLGAHLRAGVAAGVIVGRGSALADLAGVEGLLDAGANAVLVGGADPARN